MPKKDGINPIQEALNLKKQMDIIEFLLENNCLVTCTSPGAVYPFLDFISPIRYPNINIVLKKNHPYNEQGTRVVKRFVQAYLQQTPHSNPEPNEVFKGLTGQSFNEKHRLNYLVFACIERTCDEIKHTEKAKEIYATLVCLSNEYLQLQPTALQNTNAATRNTVRFLKIGQQLPIKIQEQLSMFAAEENQTCLPLDNRVAAFKKVLGIKN